MKWLLLLLLAACSVETTETYDYVTINDLITSNTPQTCDWDYEGTVDTYPTNGSFVSTGTAYYLVNTVEKDSGTTTTYAVYNESLYLWNDQTVQPIGQQMGPENYMMVVYNNTIAYATYFDLINRVDYGIVCNDTPGTLPDLPELTWITI